jgi:beta-galactosidase
MINPKLPIIFYGGDYSPDQWPEEEWIKDVELFKQANVNIVTLPVFSWAKLQPAEDRYDFEWLDKVMDLMAENGINVCLATPTAAQPIWMSLKYPEILPVDIEGRKRTPGKRVNFCPNSKKYREFASNIAVKLAQRYKDHPALAMWHVANEYGTYCYCENCAKAFREWLKQRYGTIDELNKRWNTAFWGHTLYDWNEVIVPSKLNDDDTCYPAIALDYTRFMTDSNIACYMEEYDIIKEITPDKTVTTNISGFIKKLDQFKWAQYVDIVAWDNYPTPYDDISTVALKHDIMRGLKGGQSFMVMEQSPNQQNWQPYNVLKGPGEVRLLSYQALAHGADTAMFFQLRASKGGVEKLHGALIPHAGHEYAQKTRVFQECAQLGKELNKLKDTFLDARFHSKAAIIFDWDNWWAVELSSGPSKDLHYFEQVNKYYKALYKLNIAVDIIKPTSDLSQYDLVIAPLMYMIKPNVADNLKAFVNAGGILVSTFFSGIADQNDNIILGGYPGELCDLFGIWVEEFDALMPGKKNELSICRPFGNIAGIYECGLICDVMHLEGAEALASYERDFYAGKPCVTVNDYGKGKAYYVGTDPEDRFLVDFMQALCEEKKIYAPLADIPDNVEVTQRFKDNKVFTFILNHNEFPVNVDLGQNKYFDLLSECEVSGSYPLGARGAGILERRRIL